jgi:hypothetical protein
MGVDRRSIMWTEKSIGHIARARDSRAYLI